MNNSEIANSTLKKIKNYIFYNSLTFLVLINLSLTGHAFAQNYFAQHFGQSGSDVSRSVIQLPSGSIYTAGYSDTTMIGNIDFALSKCNNNGDFIFTKYFGDSLVNNCLGMSKTNSLHIIMCGETYTSISSFDGVVYKLDTLGNILWQLQIGESSKNESLKYIFETSDGNLLACGFITDSNFSNDFLLVKISSDGNLIWQKTFGDENNNTSNMCIELTNGNYAIVGDTQGHLFDYDVMLVVTDNNGNQLWGNSYGNSLQNGSQGIFESSDGNLIIYGETEIFAASPFDFFIQKINLSGNSLWRKVFGGNRTDALFNGLEVNDGFIFTGYSNSFNSGPLNLAIVKTDTSGNLNWIQNYGGNGIDIGYSIIESVNGDGYYITGIYSDSLNSQNYLLHVSSNGYAINKSIEQDSQLSLYPNPNNGIFNIEGLEIESTVKITNSLGELIYFEKSASQKLNLNYLNKGIYFVHINNSRTSTSKKFIIQ